MYCIAFISVKKYFKKRWIFSQSIIIACFPLAVSTYPLLIRVLTFCYSWHGALLIHAAIQLHCIPCCLLLKESRAKKSISSSNSEHRILSQEMINDDISGRIQVKCDSKKAQFSDTMKPLQKHPLLGLCLVAIMMIHAGNATLFTLSPLMGYHVGSSKMEGTLLISIGSGINIPVRIIIGILGNQDWINPRIVCGCAGLSGGIMAIAISFVDSYMSLALLIAAFSIPQCEYSYFCTKIQTYIILLLYCVKSVIHFMIKCLQH